MAEGNGLLNRRTVNTVPRVRISPSPQLIKFLPDFIMNHFYVYILKSIILNKHYYGHTSNLEKRISDHNLGLSNFTKKYIPWELIYFEEFPTRSEAMKREKFFKSFDGYHWLKDNHII